MEVEAGMGRRVGAADRRGALVALEASGEVEVEAEEVEAEEVEAEGGTEGRDRSPLLLAQREVSLPSFTLPALIGRSLIFYCNMY